eukprot:scaffold39497_cov62-Phaeocystis_antarctica.AAC.2
MVQSKLCLRLLPFVSHWPPPLASAQHGGRVTCAAQTGAGGEPARWHALARSRMLMWSCQLVRSGAGVLCWCAAG